ncbi:hypothetical protein F4859DRAFT_519350 [Xylaria cf. heliscus]|nr:hypothetical protein F4859DRAFT_519350 [Xylaria cf. heliscus]
MAEKRPLKDDQTQNDEGREDSGERSRRVMRGPGMTDDEWASRERRRIRFLAHREQWGEGQGDTKGSSNNPQDLIVGGHPETTTEAGIPEPSQPSVVEEADRQERKPWESLVIGNLGENLSHIERKNREIEQQRFIVHHHEENSPHQVEHNRRILDQLIEDRNNMEDNEENNLPQDQREKEERISNRLDILQWALDSSQCEDERINIRAAIQGYNSGDIPYSSDFTLIYAGRIVDKCPTYNSFCVDRSERLDRYSANYGPGWLWQEPPLAGSGTNVLGKKGLCLSRNADTSTFNVGSYNICLEFAVQRRRVGRIGVYPVTDHTTGRKARKNSRARDATCQLETLLDSGATFPIIFESDLARLNIDFTKYPAQGALKLSTVGGVTQLKFYEMFVSVCTDEGKSLVGQGQDVVWPKEPRTLGGFCPVLVQRDPSNKRGDRLSGMIPFDACYISSAPTMRRLWLGEDRRDVLGTSRLPAHLRFDSDRTFIFQNPKEFEDLRRAARTPDRVIFLHEFPDRPDTLLTDSDVSGTRGKSELVLGKYEMVTKKSGQVVPRKALSQQVHEVEPRKGGVKIIPNNDPRSWKREFI